MFLFKLTDLKRVRISGYELWKIDNGPTHRRIGSAANLKISPEGKLLHVFKILSGDGTTRRIQRRQQGIVRTVLKDIKDSQERAVL